MRQALPQAKYVRHTVLATIAPHQGIFVLLVRICNPPSDGMFPPPVILRTQDTLLYGLSGPHGTVKAEPLVWQAEWWPLRGVNAGELGCEG